MPERPTPIDEVLDDLFTHHALTEAQREQYDKINDAARALAGVILAVCPNSPDRSDAIRKVREASMIANASIATKSGGLIPR